jgi:type IV secretory pathway TraG/TraD family ATPase VirD4
MNSQPQGRPGDEFVNLALGAVAALLALSALLRAAAGIAAWASEVRQPDGGIATGLLILAQPGDPADVFDAPGLHPIAYWTVVTLLLVALACAAWAAFRWAARGRRRATRDPRRTEGTATVTDVAAAASPRTLIKRSGTLRPSLTKPAPAQVGYLLGHAHGRQVWASVEDSMLVLGPPRSGKGLHLVVNAVLDAPGPVVTTSTRPDTLAVTMAARAKVGPVAVFDPEQLVEGLPSGLRWSPIRGCEIPRVAMTRAKGFAAGTGLGKGGTENGGFWEGKTRTVLQGLLHAAALDGRTARDLYLWSLSPTAAGDAVSILASHPDAAPGWAQALQGVVHADPRTRDPVWTGVSQSLTCLSDPVVLDCVTPSPAELFDPVAFLRANGALYLLATADGASTCASLVAAFVEDLVATAKRLAAVSPGTRLDPPLLLALDEIGNLAPLPALPGLMSEGGGSGITTMPVLQSLAQARSKWGADDANAIWDSAIVKVILGGTSSASDLRDLSLLLGERDEHTDSWTVGDHGTRSLQRSTRRVPVMPPEAIRTLPFGTGLVLLRSAPPIVADLRPWTARDDANQLKEARASVEGAVHSGPRKA